jgi:hypothetical protein
MRSLDFRERRLASDPTRPHGPTSTSEPNFHISFRDMTPSDPDLILDDVCRAVLGSLVYGERPAILVRLAANG